VDAVQLVGVKRRALGPDVHIQARTGGRKRGR
jgi:hypothetical protein